MAGFPRSDRQARPADARRRRERRRLFLRRRIGFAILLLCVMTGLYFLASSLVSRLKSPLSPAGTAAETESPGPLEPLPFKAERYLPAGDLDGNGVPEQVALGPALNALRQIALVTGSGRTERLVGQAITVPDFPMQVMDLERARGVLVLSERLPASGEPTEVTVGSEKALQAAGGEPAPKAWRLDRKAGLVPDDFYTLSAPAAPPAPTALVVDKGLNVLWQYEDGQLVKAYRIATGKFIKGPKPSYANRNQDSVTPLGRYTIANKQPGVTYFKENIPAGDPRNPLGTRWLGFSVYEGDKAAVWGIHGTNEPDKIGQWVSDGCIRLNNADVEALYARVKEGTMLEIVDSVNK